MLGEVLTVSTLKTQNVKVGPVALAVSRTQGSCPDTCAMYGEPEIDKPGPCYAQQYGQGGRPSIFMLAEKNGRPDLDVLAERIAALKAGDVVRLNVSGDYLRPDGTPDINYIAVTNAIRPDAIVISYTHAWKRLDSNMFAEHVRPNASVDDDTEAAEAIAAGWSIVMVTDERDFIAGRKAVRCPNELNKDVQCITCQLCSKTSRKSAVTFTPHGTRRNAARRAIADRQAQASEVTTDA